MFGYLMIAVSQASLITGVLHYNDKYFESSPLGIINIVIFFALLIVVEVLY